GNGWDQLGLWAYGTGELEHNKAEAAATDGNGNLVISSEKKDGIWTSARYWTQGNVNFQYGKIEARIKMPAGSFNWPAFWMLGSNYAPPNWLFGSKGWPMCGEIDIAEGLNGNSHYSSTIHANVQGTERPWNSGGGLSAPANLYDTSEVYHTYGLLWQPNEIKFIVDGSELVTNTKIGDYVIQTVGGYEFNRFKAGSVWPFNQPFFLIINNAISPGATNVADGASSKMYIDWIRYSKYQGFGAVTK
ncbi:MAG: glycoside hydrolase family 16 protein, partial [Actinomycetales bacterium]|nr:glycoside hydrolase family 16 protein [Actinomycetales bacterium]